MTGLPDTRARNALALLNEVRGAFSLPLLAADALGENEARELLEAEPLLVMLASRLRDAAPSTSLRDELRHAWNKALRRRGWKSLPSLGAQTPSAPPPQSRAADTEDPAQLVAAFLACFDVKIDARQVSAESLSLAHILAGVLMRDIETLRALPLPSPEEYAIRFHALVSRWNELARRVPDLPALPQFAPGACD